MEWLLCGLQKQISGGGILLTCLFSKQEINSEQVNNCISRLSSLRRGKTREQFQKLLLAFKNNKKGPLSFSGGVNIYLEKNSLYFTNNEIEQKYKNLDEDIYQYLTSTQIPGTEDSLTINKLLKSKNKKLIFPELVFCRDKKAHQSLGPSIKNCYKLLPQSTQYLVDHKIWFQLLSKNKKIDKNLTIELLTSCVKY